MIAILLSILVIMASLSYNTDCCPVVLHCAEPDVPLMPQVPRSIEDPILAYTAADGEINGIQWGATQPEWISICYSRVLEILRV